MIDPDAEEIVARDDPEPSRVTAKGLPQKSAETVENGSKIIEPRPDPAGLTISRANFGFRPVADIRPK